MYFLSLNGTCYICPLNYSHSLTSVHPTTHPFILRHIPQKIIFTTPPTYTILLFKIYTFRKDHSVMSVHEETIHFFMFLKEILHYTT